MSLVNGFLAKAALVAAALVLAGCTTTGSTVPTPTVVAQPTLVYPDLPPLDEPELALRPFTLDYPRDMTAAPVVKNTTECQQTPVPQRDAAFWRRCGQQPILPNSNIHVGFTYEQWLLWQQNMAALDAYVRTTRQRIELINKQREEWRRLNRQPTTPTAPAAK